MSKDRGREYQVAVCKYQVKEDREAFTAGMISVILGKAAISDELWQEAMRIAENVVELDRHQRHILGAN